MPQKIIELGQLPDGIGGDTNRSANVKCNENFAELYKTATEQSAATVALRTKTQDLERTRARNGVNKDISALEGLTTALSVQQGGTGAKDGKTACKNIGAMMLSGENVSRGTVLDNGHMPAIALIEGDNTLIGPLTITNAGNQYASCVLTLHRKGHFACFVGLDTDNQFKIGGWSMGRNSYVIYHKGNTTRAADGTLKAL
ncbi:tail fiber domain-containing protein [Pseudomonas sp. StFLB209]|uniref:hypothetical protein n=1 Tax=Pseudomonas sp. StFLB209 TaxID=1028989 RepID=UPI0004F796BE|nr:hypothetical protein [Pseudomonas sp. StFLB209]BAP44778.1 tail fiber domain-containing protein [Pseudomonas sp. StFLB209]